MPQAEVGDIVKFWAQDINPPKEKYAVCVSSPTILLLLINSKNLEMYDCYPIPKGKKFPRVESFVSCSSVFNNQSRTLEIVDKITKEDLNKIFKKIRESDTITGKLKRIILDQ